MSTLLLLLLSLIRQSLIKDHPRRWGRRLNSAGLCCPYRAFLRKSRAIAGVRVSVKGPFSLSLRVFISSYLFNPRQRRPSLRRPAGMASTTLRNVASRDSIDNRFIFDLFNLASHFCKFDLKSSQNNFKSCLSPQILTCFYPKDNLISLI